VRRTLDPPAPIDLSVSDLAGFELSGANLSEVNLGQTNLVGASLVGANLTGATLWQASLIDADLLGANLTEADLLGANLTSADLSHGRLCRANLWDANLSEANLSHADLSAANLSKAVLVHTDSAERPARRLPGLRRLTSGMYSSKALSRRRLIISAEEEIFEDQETVITVDNIETAQFIYLALNNPRIRATIDSITPNETLLHLLSERLE
jgi:uncharacterized protein YjbI with pentapeptide repeats